MAKSNLDRISKIFASFAADIAEPQTELYYINNFTLLVAVVLSAQATDVGVNKATKRLFEVADTPEKIYALGFDGLKEYIKTIGLFNAKAKNIIELSKRLIEEYHSQVPDNFDELVKLPGVGIKTANVVLNCAFHKPVIAVDTHVFRVSNRLGLIETKTPELTGEPLMAAIPEQYLYHAHHWLVLHGRYVCKARKPLCDFCKIREYCNYWLMQP